MSLKSVIPSGRHIVAAGALAAGVALFGVATAQAQALTVLPVNIQLAPGQLASTLTVINSGSAATSIQVRALAWDQPDGLEHVASSDEITASPPIATIPAGGTQIVRLVLREPPKGKEASYRILVDQIPPVAASGTVRLALRLSIPVFASPSDRANANVQFHVQSDAGKISLIGVNDGNSHETVSNIRLTTADGAVLTPSGGASPYILAGATRQWTVTTPGTAPAAGTKVQLTAISNLGKVDQSVPVVATP